MRVWEDFPGPEGIFLKRGKTSASSRLRRFPFVRRVKGGRSGPEPAVLAKSFIYPLAAAPFVFLFGTNGFLVLSRPAARRWTVRRLHVPRRPRQLPAAALVYAAVFLPRRWCPSTSSG